jgi:hypothetical protein
VKALGLLKIGWHSFRHSYRSWIGRATPPSASKKATMRHGLLPITMAYGDTQIESMRPLVNPVAKRLRP